ncbi:hypothetical protein BDW66DRAFT_154999, partial [Aspergillus desertorum]
MRAAEQAAEEAQLQWSFRRAAWQQVFPTRKISHLVRIRSLDPEPEELPTPVNERQRIAAEIKARAVEDEQHVAGETVEAEEPYDTNPWLRKTRWAQYLADVHFQDLVDVVATPDAEVADPVSHATRVVWNTKAQSARRSQQAVMSPMETACLEFCIELLNQRLKVHEYESPLVCAMAVLGWGEKAWRDPDTYTPILSRVLKVARFMVVQKALWLDPQYMDIIRMWAAAAEQGSWTGDAADDDLGMIDEGYEEGFDEIASSPPSSPPSSRNAMPISRIPRSRRMPFQAGVEWMVQRFMVRGQHGPVEVLLDWRTFGLKITYSTTAPGHVTWMGEEKLLYKEISFTMGKFRGFVHGLVGAAREIMGGLLFEPDRDKWPAIPWDALFDNPTEGTPGWSFLQDQRTTWPVAGGTWLVDRIAQEPAVARAFTTQGAVSRNKLE